METTPVGWIAAAVAALDATGAGRLATATGGATAVPGTASSAVEAMRPVGAAGTAEATSGGVSSGGGPPLMSARLT
ncbi:MAG: hypothetical protein WDN08_10605 [Rhizomicrobium sp.]